MRTWSVIAIAGIIASSVWPIVAVAQQSDSRRAEAAQVAACERHEAAGKLTPCAPDLASPGLQLGVNVGELYADNLDFAAKDEPAMHDWITSIEPFIRGAWNTPRLKARFDYTLSGYLYREHSEQNQLAHDLKTDARLVVVPEHLFLDGHARYARQLVDDGQPHANGAFFLGGNQANVATAMLSPWWWQSLGSVGEMTLRYSHGRVWYDQNGISGIQPQTRIAARHVTSDGIQWNLLSPADQPWGWHAGYVGQRLRGQSGPAIKFATTRVGVSRQLGGHARLLLDAGRENKYFNDGTVGQLEADFWELGIAWNGTRDRFKLMGGHHFYGDSASFEWNHQAARLETYLRYEEHPTDLSQQMLDQANPAGNFMPPQAEQGISDLFERRIYLLKRATGRLHYLMPRGVLGLTVAHEERTYFIGNQDHDKLDTAHLDWAWRLGARTTLTPGYGWQRRQRQLEGPRTNRYWDLQLLHRIHAGDVFSLRVRRTTRDIARPAPGDASYVANVVYLQWTHYFGGN